MDGASAGLADQGDADQDRAGGQDGHPQDEAEASRRAAALKHWGVVIGMLLARRLAARRAGLGGGLSERGVIVLDQFRDQRGRIGAGHDPLVDF